MRRRSTAPPAAAPRGRGWPRAAPRRSPGAAPDHPRCARAVVTHVEIPGGAAGLEKTFSDYRATLAENRRDLVERYRFIDFALKVVGVGSVRTRCFMVLLEGRDDGDPLLLQAKEATASVLDPYLPSSKHTNHGERIVVGQRTM